MSTCETMATSQSNIDKNKKDVQNQRKENGAGAMSSDEDHVISTPPSEIKKVIGKVSKIVSKYSTIAKDDVHMTPPPPPPTTPVQQNHVSKHFIGANALNAQFNSEITDETNGYAKWEDTFAIPPPPPMPPKQLFSVYTAKNIANVGLVSDIKSARLALKSFKSTSNESKSNEIKEMKDISDKPHKTQSLALMEISQNANFGGIFKLAERRLKMDKMVEQQLTNEPPVISVLLKKTISSNEVMTCLHHHDNNHNEEEVLSLQVLSARSSTPYTRSISCLLTPTCELNNVLQPVSPVKNDDNNNKHNLNTKKVAITTSKSVPSLAKLDGCEKNISKTKSSIHVSSNDSIVRYSRCKLRMIRNEMSNLKLKQSFLPFLGPNIVNCDAIELSERLKRLNISKTLSDAEDTRNNNNNIGHNNNIDTLKSRCNDMMPAFVKRKFMDESIIRSQPPQLLDFKDPAIITNQRRIGSGRIAHNKWSGNYLSQFGNQHNQTKLPEYDQLQKQLNVEKNITVLGEKSYKERSADACIGKSNYVKKVVSGFLVVSNPKCRETEENYEQRNQNQQNEEPEWFSCGPTSRLDTIELCGFDEDENKHLSSENNSGESTGDAVEIDGDDVNSDESKENCIQNANKIESSGKSKFTDNLNKYRKFNAKSDSNNNVQNSKITDAAKIINRNEKSDRGPNKSISFQYDQFSGNTKLRSYMNQNRSSVEINGIGGEQHNQKVSSRFLPLFGANPSQSNSVEQLENKGSSLLNQFFKQAIKSQKKADVLQQPNTISSNVNINEILSVDELEAKWRRNSSTGENNITENFCNDQNNNNINPDSENFRKLIGQLNNYSVPQSEQLPTQTNYSNNNVNNENLSNLIFKQQLQQKHLRQQQQQSTEMPQINSLQQQFNKQNVFLQQQQAALLANLQLKSILNRPEAQIYLLGLAKGDISRHGLVVQLANPHLPQKEREAMTAVLTFTSTQQQQQQQFGTLSNNLIMNQLQNLQNLAIVQQTLAAQQQQHLQLQGGNKPLTTMQPMSQEELQTHASIIMQNALIKRKIEEQKNILGLQKILQLNAAAQVVKQQHQHQIHNRNISDSGNFNNQNLNRNMAGGRRLQALQNLFNDSNGMINNAQQQKNFNAANVDGNGSLNTNFRNNRNANNQNQRKRSTGPISGIIPKFPTDTEYLHQKSQQCRVLEQQTHSQISTMTIPHLHHSGRTNNVTVPAKQPAVVFSGNDFN